ncbi:MAG: D-glycero-beta-D-manno-heptose-7-phosphate kinase [Hyphomonadaceae bacterium]|nr:D-glycero-beta-D-manno-heptose-7-phosphate kinase [Hyphomonadaceae bacterium]
MLDHYVFGAVSRISPEAPVPVLHVASERHVLGGAANVAANVAILGARARLVGVIGDDAAGRQMLTMLDAVGQIDPLLWVDRGGTTITKTRYLGGQQQLVRVDREQLSELSAPTIRGLIEYLEDCLRECDVFVLSDYGKGVLNDQVLQWFLPTAARAGKQVIVDPKRRTLENYRGATFITPNRKELENAVGINCDTDDGAATAAGKAQEQSGAAILLTRSEKGMSLYREGKEALHLSAEAKEVFDVSGAGDTVVAALASCLAASHPIEHALRVANAAAGVVVGKLGTATCAPAELIAALKRRSDRPEVEELRLPATDQAPISLNQLVEIRETWRRAGLVVGFTNGCFDLIHPGHVTLLQKSAQACDRLIVAINSDASVRRLKGDARPVQGELNRAAVLRSIRGVDEVMIFEEETPLEAVRALRPDVLVKGSDYTEEQVVGGDVVRASGGRVLLVDLVEGHSTTALVERSLRTKS